MSSPPPSTAKRNARYGILLFLIYLVFYGGFVAMSAFAHESMKVPIDALGGINLAIAYGMGLIVLALVLAMIYMGLCRGGGAAEDEGGTL